MKQSIVTLFLFVTAIVSAQRDTREILNAEDIEIIEINTDEVFRIEIIASKRSGIRITTHSEGEYYDEIILETKVIDHLLLINTKYPKILSGGYDKLSAHKVFSLEIVLEIPEGIEVLINSNISSLVTQGSFQSISANLKQGYCQLLNFDGNATINTYNGNILVETATGIIDANSRHGNIEIPDFLPGRNPIKLTTIDGNILVRKTK